MADHELTTDELYALNDELTTTLATQHKWVAKSDEDYERLNDLVHDVAGVRAKEFDLLDAFARPQISTEAGNL